MSVSHRNRDFFRLRVLSKQMSALLSDSVGRHYTDPEPLPPPEYLALEVEFDRIWAKYGFKSMVMDRRRRVSTRKANQKGQRVVARAAKRSERDRLRLELIRELAQ